MPGKFYIPPDKRLKLSVDELACKALEVLQHNDRMSPTERSRVVSYYPFQLSSIRAFELTQHGEQRDRAFDNLFAEAKAILYRKVYVIADPGQSADDFVILSRGYAAEALAWTDGVMTRLGLTLNRTKTRLCDARSDRFDFLGYSFGPHCHRQQGRWFTGASPSNKSVQRLKDKLGAILVPGNKGAWDEVSGTLNRLLRGWCGYFSPGSHYATDRVIEAHVYDHVLNFLARRQKLPSRGSRHIRKDAVFSTMGVLQPRRCRHTGVLS